MLFLFKSSKLHLDCFTDNSGVYHSYPIVDGAQCYPDWWKNLDKSYFDFDKMQPYTTMKLCPGIFDYYKHSVCIRLWSELAVQNNPNGSRYQFSDGKSSIVYHPRFQWGEFLDERFSQMKIQSPWHFSCKDDVHWVMVGDNWGKNLSNEFHIQSGVTNFHTIRETHINCVYKNINQNLMFSPGTPLVHLFPMSDKKVVIHNHLVSKEELERINGKDNLHQYFYNRYFKFRNAQEKKCPFHKGSNSG